MSRSLLCWRRKFIELNAVGASSHHSEIWEHHFRDGYRQKDRADDCIEFEEGGVDPFQTAFPRQPVFQHEAAEDENQASEVCHPESAKQTEEHEQTPHEHV